MSWLLCCYVITQGSAHATLCSTRMTLDGYFSLSRSFWNKTNQLYVFWTYVCTVHCEKPFAPFFLSVSQLPNFIYNDMEIEYLHEGNRWQEFQQTKRSGSCGTRVPEGCCARETSCEVIITVSSLETLRFMMKINIRNLALQLGSSIGDMEGQI